MTKPETTKAKPAPQKGNASAEMDELRTQLAATQAVLANVIGGLWYRKAQPVSIDQWRSGETAKGCAAMIGATDNPTAVAEINRIHAMAAGATFKR